MLCNLTMSRGDMKVKKIILFSPTGYVGSNIEERVQGKGHIQLHVMSRGSDFGNYGKGYDAFIYSAAVTSARHETAEKYVQDNVVAAVSVVNFCKEHEVNRIIFLSSDEIYGELNTETVSDRAVMVNPNLYATTKYLAEKIIIESGIPYYILRLPGIVGKAWGKGFIYSLISKAKNNEKITLYNMERMFNNIVDIDDLTAFIAHLCDCEVKDKSEIFLLGNTDKVPLKEIVFYIKSICHSDSAIDNVETDQKRYFTLDVSKAVEYGYSSKKIKTIIDELYQLQE